MTYFNLHTDHQRSSSYLEKKFFVKSKKPTQKQKKNSQYLLVKKQSDHKNNKRFLSSNKLALVSSQKIFKNRPPPQLKKDKKTFQSINFENEYYQFKLFTDNHKNQKYMKETLKKSIIQPSSSHKKINSHQKMKSDEESTNQFKVNSQYQDQITSLQNKRQQNKTKNHQQKSSQLHINLKYKERKKKDDPYFVKQRLKKQIRQFKSLQKNHDIQCKMLLSSQTKNLTQRQQHRLLKIQTIQKKQLAESIFSLKERLDHEIQDNRKVQRF